MSHVADLGPVLCSYEKWLEAQEAHYLEQALKLSKLPNVENEIKRLHIVAAVFSTCLCKIQLDQQVLPRKRSGILATIFGA